MKEIKFRVYHKKHKKIYDVFKLFFGIGNSKWVAVVADNIQCEEVDDEIAILMQYTGLKDKNGKKIYVGDIIEIKDRGFVSVYWDKEEAMFEIDIPLMPFYKAARKGKIVGNIYENKELLNI